MSDAVKEVVEDVVVDEAKVIDRIETIMPLKNCKECLSRGWYNFLPPEKCGVSKVKTKKGHKRTRLFDFERKPCGCLSKQYLKRNPGVRPKFDEADGKVFITLEFLAKEEDVASGDVEDLKKVVEKLQE